MGGAGESRAGVDQVGCGSRLGCEWGGPALHGRSRWRRRRSDWGCGVATVLLIGGRGEVGRAHAGDLSALRRLSGYCSPASSAESRFLPSPPRRLGGEGGARSLAGRDTGSLHHQASARPPREVRAPQGDSASSNARGSSSSRDSTMIEPAGRRTVPTYPLLAWADPTGTNQEGGERSAYAHRQRG